MAETAGTVWLGLTMNCCRCHDHKFDPITQADYYADRSVMLTRSPLPRTAPPILLA
jgi:hypothetical protein